jgi:endogenous inhibitor of DNA gyrase (YacG/DUF329 family)
MNQGSTPGIKVRCPQCKRDSIFSEENPFRPFCSKRCRLIDLGQWASEGYKVPVEDPSAIQEAFAKLELDAESSED